MDLLTNIVKELLHISLVSIPMVIVIMIIRQLFHKRIKAKWSYALWLVLLVRLLFPFQVESPISIENVIEEPFALFYQENEAINNNYSEATIITYSTLDKEVYESVSDMDLVFEVFTYIWLLGIAIVVFMPIISYITLKKAVNEEDKKYRKRISEILFKAQTLSGVIQAMEVRYSYYLDSPALIGVFKPLIILPFDHLQEDEDTLKQMFLHELLHYKHKHLVFQWLFWIVKAIYWFNPLIWLAHEWMKLDAEYMCDEEVVDLLGDEKSYGTVLIDLVENSSNNHYTINAAGLVNKKSELKKRIIRLGYHRKKRPVLNVLTIVVLLLMCPVFFTIQAQEQEITPNLIASGGLIDHIKTDEVMEIELLDYSYETKTEALTVHFQYNFLEPYKELIDYSYEANNGFMDAVLEMYFPIYFKKSFNPEMRDSNLGSYGSELTYDGRVGRGEIVYILEDYDPKKDGPPTIVLGNFRLMCHNTFAPVEVVLTKESLPLTIEIDDYISVSYMDLVVDQQKGEVRVKSTFDKMDNFRVDINEHFEVVDKEGRMHTPTSRSISGSETSNDYTFNLHEMVNDTYDLLLYIDGYTLEYQDIYISGRHSSDLQWTFDIDIENAEVIENE